ncbi:MAG: hypothetical protein AB9842_07420 [Bacteroidales bacterium]
MKKNALLFGFVLAFIGFSLVTNAAVLRVNSAPGSTTSYTTAQAAHDAASANDTIYLESSGISYGYLQVTKKLTIIGTGYFLAQNPQTQAVPAAATIDGLSFYYGSNGSKITGCQINSYIYIYDNNILISRNYVNGYQNAIYQQASTLSNIVITQNYIMTYYAQWNALYFGNANNVLIMNNYIFGSLYSGTTFSGMVGNNVINGSYLQMYNTTYVNNILIDGTFYNYNCVATYNLANSTQFGDQNGNQQNINMSTVFVGATGNSTDGQYQLKTGSPALGAGENGVDCGMFGGSFPYVLSGMPNIPAIYYMNAPAIPSNSINVSIKAKSHN